MKNLTRSRWAAIGAAVAVTLGGGGLIGVSASETSSTLTPVSPVRVVDTRSTGKVGNIGDGASITVQITGAIETVKEGTKTVVPDGASAIIGNLTLVGTHANDYGGFATVYPCGDRPEASNVNFTSGKTIANSVAVSLSATGTVCIYVYGTAHVLFDVSGYYTTSEISEVAASLVSLEDEVTAVESEVDDVAEDVGRLQTGEPLYPRRGVAGNGAIDFTPQIHGDWAEYTGMASYFGAPITPDRYSEEATVELTFALQGWFGDAEDQLCFRIESTTIGTLVDSETCITQDNMPKGYLPYFFTTEAVPLPSSGVLYPKVKVTGDGGFPNLYWFGFHVYD